MKKVLILSLALILLLGLAAHGTFGLFSDTETSTGNTFTAWVEECACAKFNVCDKTGSSRKVFQYDADGDLLGSFDLDADNDKPSGVASVDNYVYILDQADHEVYKYDCCGNLLEVSRKLTKNGSIGNPDGLAIYGDDMWVVMWGPDDYIYRYSLTDAFSGSGDLDAEGQIALHDDNTNSAGLAVDDVNYVYVVDSTDKKLYRYPHPDGAHAGEDVAISKLLKDYNGNDIGDPPGELAGAMCDGASLWVADSDTDMLYEYGKTSLFTESGSENSIPNEFPLDGDNGTPTGV